MRAVAKKVTAGGRLSGNEATLRQENSGSQRHVQVSHAAATRRDDVNLVSCKKKKKITSMTPLLCTRQGFESGRCQEPLKQRNVVVSVD